MDVDEPDLVAPARSTAQEIAAGPRVGIEGPLHVDQRRVHDEDLEHLQHNVSLAKHAAKKAKRRLRYAETKLKELGYGLLVEGLVNIEQTDELYIQSATILKDIDGSMSRVGSNRQAPPSVVECAMRKDRVDMARAECERYDAEVLLAKSLWERALQTRNTRIDLRG